MTATLPHTNNPILQESYGLSPLCVIVDRIKLQTIAFRFSTFVCNYSKSLSLSSSKRIQRRAQKATGNQKYSCLHKHPLPKELSQPSHSYEELQWATWLLVSPALLPSQGPVKEPGWSISCDLVNTWSELLLLTTISVKEKQLEWDIEEKGLHEARGTEQLSHGRYLRKKYQQKQNLNFQCQIFNGTNGMTNTWRFYKNYKRR